MEGLQNTLTDRLYNFIIGLVLLWGFGINILICNINFAALHIDIDTICIVGTILMFAGVFISAKSQKPLISFLGYSLVVIPIGVMLNILLQDQNAAVIKETCMITAVVTITLIVLGSIFPGLFLSMRKILFISLLSVLIVEFLFLFLGYSNSSLDWITALIFCGYIGYDWARAQRKPKTLDNAIDSVVELYLDIINLFLRLMGKRGKKSK